MHHTSDACAPKSACLFDPQSGTILPETTPWVDIFCWIGLLSESFSLTWYVAYRNLRIMVSDEILVSINHALLSIGYLRV